MELTKTLAMILAMKGLLVNRISFLLKLWTFAIAICCASFAAAQSEETAAEPSSTQTKAEEAIDEAAQNARASLDEHEEVAGTESAAGETSLTVDADELIATLTDPLIEPKELDLLILPLTADELMLLTDAWQNIVKGLTRAVVTEQLAVLEIEADGGSASRERLTELSEARNDAFAKFASIVSSFEAKGGDPAEVAQYRAYRAAIIVEEKQAADWRTLAAQTLDWTTDRDGGVQLLSQVLVIVAAFVGLIIVARLARGFARRMLRRVPQVSKLLQSFFVMVVYWLTVAIGLMIVLSALGIDITPLFALVGGASFIIAFAMQDTLGNLAAGLMIMFNRPFDEGDYVTVAGTGGTVQSVSIVSTTVVTPDNQVIVIPNSRVWGDIITNVTASDTRRVDLVFGIGYGDSIEQAQKVLEQVVAAHPLVLSDPAPMIRVSALGASSVDFICRPWVNVADYWSVYWDLTRQVKEAFDREGISIPFPQTDMHLHVVDQSATPLTPNAPVQPQVVRSFAEGDSDTIEQEPTDGGR